MNTPSGNGGNALKIGALNILMDPVNPGAKVVVARTPTQDGKPQVGLAGDFDIDQLLGIAAEQLERAGVQGSPYFPVLQSIRQTQEHQLVQEQQTGSNYWQQSGFAQGQQQFGQTYQRGRVQGTGQQPT
jgi:hypothetical protein